MAVCRFDTKKNAFHKTSALVTITTVPTPQDRALMWTATPGKSANHGSPWHCNVTLLRTSADKYYHSDYWITVALPFVSQCLWEASVEVYTACVWRRVSCDRRDTLHQLWWTQVLVSWTLPIRTSSGKASILALFPPLSLIFTCFPSFFCLPSRITVTGWTAHLGFWWRTRLVGSQATAAVKASQCCTWEDWLSWNTRR